MESNNVTPNPHTQYTPAEQARNKRTRNIILGALSGVIVLCCLIAGSVAAVSGGKGNTSSTATAGNAQVIHNGPTSTPEPPTATPKPKVWTVVQSFSGNGSQKTASFDLSANNWRIVWTCDPSSFYGSSYNVMIDVYNSDGSFADLGAVNTICGTGNARGTAEEHNVSGSLYLDVNSEAVWSIKVEVLQ